MNFKGLHKVSLIDYPGKICAIAFTGGCNFRCHYCHNPELVLGHKDLPDIKGEEILSFLKRRKGLLDALEITGGEPTIWEKLPAFMKQVKELGFLVKLDTNGMNPDMLSEVVGSKLVDYVAMDIKATLERYEEVVGVELDVSKIKRSVEILLEGEVEYEFRTTTFPEFFAEEDARQIGDWVKGAERYALQMPRTEKTLNGNFRPQKLYTKEELQGLSQFLPNCTVR
jgi:pyruvate formate lyase activating enzyme